MCQQNFPKRVNLMPKIGFVHLIEPTLNKEEDMMKEANPFVMDPKVMSMHKA